MGESKFKSFRSKTETVPRLPDRLARLMTSAHYAELVARRSAVRTAFLPEIVSLHTRRDLEQIDGLGPASIKKLEKWLACYGKRLRQPDESLDAVICGFDIRRAPKSVAHHASVP
jgi:hypothetical protein